MQTTTNTVVNQKREAFNKWKNGACRFQCQICGATCPNSLDFASHQRAAHGLDLIDYATGHGHSRVHTEHIDCAMCTESVMHDLGAFRRHLLVVHAGVSMEDYFARHVVPKMPKAVPTVTTMRIVVQQQPEQEQQQQEEIVQQQIVQTYSNQVIVETSAPSPPRQVQVVTTPAPVVTTPVTSRGSAAKRKTKVVPMATRASKRSRGLDMPGI